MKQQRILFAIVLLAIGLGSIAYMNTKYDRLSRYPYKDEVKRDLIRQYCTDEEIEYIIEYAISPSAFIRFIEANEFNMFHLNEYKMIEDVLPEVEPTKIVTLVERAFPFVSMEELQILLYYYSYDEALFWYTFGDPYCPDPELVKVPDHLHVWLDDRFTISTYVPPYLTEVTETMPHDEEVQLVSGVLVKPYEQMCQAIEADLKMKNCGGLIIEKAYVDYDTQVQLYKQAQEKWGDNALAYVSYPGHDEHQLGTSVDLRVEGEEDFTQTEQYAWLMDYAVEYGFAQTLTDESVADTNKVPQLNHFRYVGGDVSNIMKYNGKTFKEVTTEVRP